MGWIGLLQRTAASSKPTACAGMCSRWASLRAPRRCCCWCTAPALPPTPGARWRRCWRSSTACWPSTCRAMLSPARPRRCNSRCRAWRVPWPRCCSSCMRARRWPSATLPGQRCWCAWCWTGCWIRCSAWPPSTVLFCPLAGLPRRCLRRWRACSMPHPSCPGYSRAALPIWRWWSGWFAEPAHSSTRKASRGTPV